MDASIIFTILGGLAVRAYQLLYWYLEAFYHLIIPPPMESIDGETILVTGAVGGIGKEICRHVVRSGQDIKLVLWDLNEVDLKKFEAELMSMGKGRALKVFPFAVDISSRENIDECCRKVKDAIGPVTIIFNNAGICPFGNFLMQSNLQIESTFQINLMSHLWILRQFLPDMVARNHGRIVNICSAGGLQAAQHALPYFSSKFGVNGYSEALRAELGMFNCDGIRLTTVYPWFVKTPMIRTMGVNKEASGGHWVPSRFLEFLEPEEVGRKAVEGMRRGYEYIYLPMHILGLVLIDWILPMKARKAWQPASYSNYYTYKDAEDQKSLFTSFSDVINGNVKGMMGDNEIRRNNA